MPLDSGLNNWVWALTVFDDGTGPALYAAGSFTTAGGAADGTGPAVYAGGQFSTAGGVAANSVAKWDGTQWAPLDTGTNGIVFALTVFDDGNGPALYVGGSFTRAGGQLASSIAAWVCSVP